MAGKVQGAIGCAAAGHRETLMAGIADSARKQAGFLSVADTAAFASRGISLLDPHSTLISPGVAIAGGVTLWPCVTLDLRDGGEISIGEGTQLHSGTRIVAHRGRVVIGRDAEIGEEGGFTIKAESEGCVIEIGDGARLLGGGSLMLDNVIGSGAQVLGPIRMQQCALGAGGTHREPDPDRRGAVLKGAGVARNIRLPVGKVVQAFGLFAEAPIRDQSYFHPKPDRGE
jgi:carbonic anhydrase/acetyltransferase-like protein (isoleucine patch superfamily)